MPSTGLGDTVSDVLALVAPQIHDLVKAESDRAAAAAEVKAEAKIQEAEAASKRYIIVVGVAGGLLGGLLGWALARRS